MIEKKRKSNTINSYISAIKAILSLNQVKINEDRFLLNSLTRACKLKNDQLRTRLPIGGNLLNLIIKKIEEIYDQQPYLATLYRCMFAVGYHGLLRIGEMTKSPHVIKARDVLLATNKNKLMLILRSSKTHNKSQKPQVIKLNKLRRKVNQHNQQQESGNIARTCPFLALREYAAMRPTSMKASEQFFVFRDNSSVRAANMRSVLKEA